MELGRLLVPGWHHISTGFIPGANATHILGWKGQTHEPTGGWPRTPTNSGDHPVPVDKAAQRSVLRSLARSGSSMCSEPYQVRRVHVGRESGGDGGRLVLDVAGGRTPESRSVDRRNL
jgi:hypothetical protein